MGDEGVSLRLARVQERVVQACARSGRSVSSVQLIAVSKTRSNAELRAVLELGQAALGENYAQELRDKAAHFEELPAATPPRWHFIGNLQRNKARYVAGVATLVHTVDSVKLGRALANRAPNGQDVLAQVNVGGEASKSGVPPEQALELCRQLTQLDGLRLRGLMTIPPAVGSPEQARPYFAALARLAEEGRAQGLPLTELSMGMSGDFEVAIEEGATLVRVGTAIFGPRA